MHVNLFLGVAAFCFWVGSVLMYFNQEIRDAIRGWFARRAAKRPEIIPPR